MKGVELQASGYSWNCDECGRENYTGAAPQSVRCAACRAEYPVAELAHRVADRGAEQPSFLGLDSPRADGSSKGRTEVLRGTLQEVEND